MRALTFRTATTQCDKDATPLRRGEVCRCNYYNHFADVNFSGRLHSVWLVGCVWNKRYVFVCVRESAWCSYNYHSRSLYPGAVLMPSSNDNAHVYIYFHYLMLSPLKKISFRFSWCCVRVWARPKTPPVKCVCVCVRVYVKITFILARFSGIYRNLGHKE